MTEIHPPRVAEAILESFGADADFRDAILGDLAQEHAARADRYNERAAKLWYYRQALLASPALLRNWLSKAGWADARRLLNVAGLAYVGTMMIEVAVVFAIAAVGYAAGFEVLGGGLLGRSGFLPVVLASTKTQLFAGLVAGIFGPICAGYLAASFEEQRPMIGAAAFAAASTLFILVAIALVPAAPPGLLEMETWRFVSLRLAAIPLIAVCCLAGGALRVRVVSDRQAAAAPSRLS